MGEPNILILDDEAEMRALLQRYLTSQGFAVQVATNPQQLDTLLARRSFDVLVLDLMMPGESGLEICRRLRAAGDTIPIMMLTAKGDPVDRIVGLEMGADDYLPKPFEPRELAARLHAMVRRQKMYGDGTGSASEETIQFGPFRLDLGSRTLMRDGEPVALTSGEFALLRALARNPGRPLGRERLIALAAGKNGVRNELATDRSIDVQVLRLRRLIEEDPATPRYIQTVWGVGYLFAPNGTRT